MHFTELRVSNFRNIVELHLDLAPGINVFTGPNGAGKTSILEAAHVLSYGGSFRTGQVDRMQRRQSDPMALFALVEARRQSRRLGLLRRGGRWISKLDGQTPSSLSELFTACAVVCFEPGSHALISGASDLRRSFIDWGVFHVEPGFTDVMRRFRRALRQRNALLKQDSNDHELSIWDEELAHASEPLAAARERYMDRFTTQLLPILNSYLPELGRLDLRFRAGWDRTLGLVDVLSGARSRDRALGHTTRGPHRADWALVFEEAPNHEQLSRGQEKLCAIACILAQAMLHRSIREEWPIIAMDDFCSELDAAHQKIALSLLNSSGAQVLLTGTEIPDSLLQTLNVSRRFHVEQGQVQALL